MGDIKKIDIEYNKDERRIPFSGEESKRFLRMVMARIAEDLRLDGRFNKVEDTYSNPDSRHRLRSQSDCYLWEVEELPKRHFFSRQKSRGNVLLVIEMQYNLVNPISGNRFYTPGSIRIYDPRVEEALSKALAIYYTPFADVPLPKFFKKYNDTKRKLFLAQAGDKVEINYSETKPASGYMYSSGLVVKG